MLIDWYLARLVRKANEYSMIQDKTGKLRYVNPEIEKKMLKSGKHPELMKGVRKNAR